MDTSQIYMVRSAKGNDMLCVDSFLYYYDDKGYQTYRWSCSRRKDKIFPCKSRIVTTLLDGDETKHVIAKTYGEHSHVRCPAEVISVAFERKRLANLEGKPCTLEAKKRKSKNLEEGDIEGGGTSSKTVTPPKKLFKRENDEAATSSATKKLSEGDFEDSSNPLNSLQKNTVYMLKTSHGKDMICVDGYLYRFEGNKEGGSICRWECCRRRDDGCKARLRTECISYGKHQLKEKRQFHNHDPYPQTKLMKLFNKHKINKTQTENSGNVKIEQKDEDSVEEFESINCTKNSTFFKVMPETNESAIDVYNDAIEIYDIETIFDIDKGDPDEKDESIDALEKSMKEVEPEEKSSENFNTDNDPDPLEGKEGNKSFKIKTDLDITKVRTLPSARGNKLLCVDNFLYHYDTRSTKVIRTYWTCIHRRDKIYNCRARITTEIQKTGELKVVKVFGKHLHPNDIEKIRNKIFQNHEYAKKEKKEAKKQCENVGAATDNCADNIESSRESLQRKILKLREIQKKSFEDLQRKIKIDKNDDDNDEISLSSFSEDDMNLPALPANLEQMMTNVQSTSHDQSKNYKQVVQNFKLNVEEHAGNISSGSESPCDVILESDMDLNKISVLRSAKGGELLCVDDYLYHVKGIRDIRTYWECIKSKTPTLKCKSRINTVMTSRGYVIKKVTNVHNHPTSKADIHKRLINSCKERSETKPTDYMVLLERKLLYLEQKCGKVRAAIKRQNKCKRTVMKLYAVSDGPPSLAVRMTLNALKIPFELINVDYCASEHLTEEYEKLNPQKEIPVLDDDGFYLSESIAIMQYVCDKYGDHNELYPKDPKKRALVNHRLCFNMGFYYASISAYVMAPIFFDYPRDEMGLKKVKNALSVFETYLKRTNTKFAADDHLTIADFALVSSTLCLEAIDFDLSPYPFVKHWYENFKDEFPQLWEIGKVGMREIETFEHNPPDLSHMNHPFHPTRKITK